MADRLTIGWEAAARLFGYGQDAEGLKSKFLKTGENEESPELLPDNEVDSLVITLGSKRLSKVEEDAKKEHYSRGLRETAEKWESVIKEYVDSNTKGPELVSELVDRLKSESKKGGAPKELDEESLRKLPVFEKVLNSEVSTLKSTIDELKSTLESKTRAFELDRLKRTVVSRAISVLDEENVYLGSDEQARKRAVKAIEALLPYQSLKEDDGRIVIVDEDGKPKLDDMKDPIPFKDLVLSINPFPKKEVEEQRTPKGQGGKGGRGDRGGDKGLKIKSKEQYETLMLEANKLQGKARTQKRAEIRRAYAESLRGESES
jgi:hypothetical protein